MVAEISADISAWIAEGATKGVVPSTVMVCIYLISNKLWNSNAEGASLFVVPSAQHPTPMYLIGFLLRYGEF